MCDKTGENNNVDWICLKTMLNTNSIRRVKDVCNDLGFGEIAPFLERIARNQEALINEMRKHTSQIFEYELANKLETLEYLGGGMGFDAHEKGCCADCGTQCVQCNPGGFYPTTD